MKELNSTIMHYELVILGGGVAGYTAALRAAQLGRKTALIEAECLGGHSRCTGCIPSSDMLWNAQFIQECTEAAQHGIHIQDVSVDMKKMFKNREEKLEREAERIADLLNHCGVAVYHGSGSVLPDHRMRVTSQDNTVEIIGWDKLLIATGAHPTVPKMYRDIPGLMTSREIFNINYRPDELTILGGGVAACEAAVSFSALGTKVTILQNSDRLLKRVDSECLCRLEDNLRKRGVAVHYNTRVQEIYRDSVGNYHLDVLYDGMEKAISMTTGTVMLAMGQEANVRGLEALALNLHDGCIEVDRTLKASAKDVYAAGDAVSQTFLTGSASNMAFCAIDNIFGNVQHPIDYSCIPVTLNLLPEVAFVGVDESFVDVEYVLGVYENDCLYIKLIVEKYYGEILGVHAVGEGASALVKQAAVIMQMEGTIDDLLGTTYYHPTTDLSLFEAALKAKEALLNKELNEIEEKS